MPWKNVSPMEQKHRFVSLAHSGHFTVTELCVEFGISRKTDHKWLARHAQAGMKGLEERSRAPHGVTGRTPVHRGIGVSQGFQSSVSEVRATSHFDSTAPRFAI
jgi:transposase-like protein